MAEYDLTIRVRVTKEKEEEITSFFQEKGWILR
jgi:hypothetical protein